ncbi:Glucose-1-phosphate adenylyltransferase large subunit, chloroplastic/amyloplastic [Sesamum angolense]|uniref:glucose-1-phosphate adenylyltransferase n=1 Tax=Sesamum angolense TaxID=2727404 RepID=A0AAE1W672_9LAMI|nr:Glucose-1-phosphate adenylyltransferase large subunit, chloroplastic/amyloplastic [Sesamum angolense]
MKPKVLPIQINGGLSDRDTGFWGDSVKGRSKTIFWGLRSGRRALALESSFLEENPKADPKTVASIILGGGAGTRLYPLTSRRAKPAYNSFSLNRHLARTYNFGNGMNFGDGFVEVLAATQTPGDTGKRWFQGTADAVRQFIWVFEDAKHKNIEHIVILSGDHLYRMDYMDFVQKHIDTNADITVSCVPMDDSRASDYGLMKIDETGQIIQFAEKPKGSALKAMAYLFSDYWEDIGTIKSFFDANLALTEQHLKFDLNDPKTPFYTSPRFLPPTKVEKCRIVDAIISHGCFLRECSVQHSIVGVRSRLDYGVELKDTMMMGADYYQTESEIASLLAEGKVPIGVGHNTKISNCIIDKNAKIGKDVIIANKDGVEEAERADEGFYIRSGIVVLLKKTTIKDGTII